LRATNRTLSLAWKAWNVGACIDTAMAWQAQARRSDVAHILTAHAQVIGGLALAYTAVPIERAALLGEEAATTQHAQAPAESW
jgi:hypothetical protein